MIIGIGIDIVELKRIEKVLTSHSKFADRILTSKEKEHFNMLHGRRKIEFLAGRFAAKEAFAKAYGTGIGQDLAFIDIEISNDEKGKPVFTRPIYEKSHLSISHSQEYAVAQVILEKSPN